ncbi:Coilin, partial [Frankliniella fusca]
MANSKYVVCFGAESVLELMNSSNSNRGRGRGRYHRGRGRGYFRGRGHSYMPYYRYNWQRNEVGFVKNETVERQEVKSELSDSESIGSSSSIVKSFNTSCCVQSPEESAATGGSSRLKQVNVVDKSNVAGSSKEAASDLLPTNTCEFPKLENYCMLGDSFSLRMCKTIDPSVQ